MKNNIQISFDSGGGITIMTKSYCHYYENVEEAAKDYLALLQGADPSNWDGNQPEYRFCDAENDYGAAFDLFTKIVKEGGE